MSSNDGHWAKLALLVAGCAALGGGGAVAAEVDLAALRVTPEHGQTADQARRDRYECHNWAVEQSGETPAAAPVVEDARRDRDREARADKVERVITGAAIGSVLGSILHGSRHRRDSGDAVLAGAAVGAAVGAATDGASQRDAKDDAKDDRVAPQSGYLRALSACLEGRGYTVDLPVKEADSKRR
jgi:hypothetical protein